MEKNTAGGTDGESIAKCVDVSSYQGDVDWRLVKSAGIDRAILKVIRKDSNPDKKFEQNWKNCRSAGVNVDGVYNYSYAVTAAKAATDAQKVLSVLGGRKCTVWLDVEDKCQQGLGSLLKDIVCAYKEVISNAGYDFGIYTGMSFYNSWLKPYAPQIDCDNLWIARYYNSYAKMAVSQNPNERYNPKTNIGRDIYAWQYTSSGQLPGISGGVDLSAIYKPLRTLSSAQNAAMGRVSDCTKLNMRKAPSVAANNVITVLNVNDVVALISRTDNGWYQVKTKDDLVGYVSGRYITLL